MAVQLVNGPNGNGVNLLQTVSPPGYGRAYATTTVQVVRQGVLRPAAFSQWEALYPGTDSQYLGPLYGDAYGETPIVFPQRTDERGLIQVWAPEPVRIELRVSVYGYPSVKQVIDLQFTEDPGDTALDALAAHAADPGDPHAAAGYITMAEADAQFLTPAEGDALFLTQAEGDNRYAFAGLSGITQDAADARYVNISGDTMTGSLLPNAINAIDLGSNTFPWRRVYANEGYHNSVTIGFDAAAVIHRRLAGVVDIDNHLAVGVPDFPATWPTAYRTVQFGKTGALWAGYAAAGIGLGDNTRYDGSTFAALVAGPASYLQLGNGGFEFKTAPSVGAVAAQTFTTKMSVALNGTVTLFPDATQWGIVSSGGVFMDVPAPAILLNLRSGGANRAVLSAVGTLSLTPDPAQPALNWGTYGYLGSEDGHPEISSSSGILFVRGALAPFLDNNVALGGANNRWTVVYAANGAINTCRAEEKDLLGLVDPAGALDAILRTPIKMYHPKGGAGLTLAGIVDDSADPRLQVGPGSQTSATHQAGMLMAAVQALAARVAELERVEAR